MGGMRVFLVCLLLWMGGAVRAADPTIAYTVEMPKPQTHLLSVTLRLTRPVGRMLELAMPVWTPGSYLIREFARNVQDVTVTDGSDRPLPWRKTDKSTWRVETGEAQNVIVRYQVWCNDPAVQAAEVSESHAFWNATATLMYLVGRLALPSTVTIVPPPGSDWKVATGLEKIGENVYRAADFDELYDCPVEVGPFTRLTFTAGGAAHHIVLDGPGNYAPERLTTDLKKVVETHLALFGGAPPYKEYTFLVHLRAGGGGLEHRNSTTLGFGGFGFSADGPTKSFLDLASHEFFHLWNVKRIKPDALGPFDYSRENPTRLLWVAEGWTSYYGPLLVRRSNLTTPADYLSGLAGSIAALERTPGRRRMSVEEASFDAWIKYYRPDENAVNSQISYYTKGSLIALLLDLTIRGRTTGAKSLDDVLRLLWERHGKTGKNVTAGDLQHACEEIAGGSLEPLFATAVRGRDELSFDDALATVGLRLLRSGDAKEPKKEAWLGANLTLTGERLLVSSVPDDTPAFDQGLVPGDWILAVDGLRVGSVADFTARLSERGPGQMVSIALFRGSSLRTLTVTLGERVKPDYKLVPVETPTDAQKKAYAAWLGDGAELKARTP
jgi:predicted metalloprotease with PDZ domain